MTDKPNGLTEADLAAMRERCETMGNAMFFLKARTDVPRLLAEVERLKAENAKLREVVEAAKAVTTKIPCYNDDGICDSFIPYNIHVIPNLREKLEALNATDD